MQRIESFLGEVEVPAWASSFKIFDSDIHNPSTEIGFSTAIFEWHSVSKSDSSPARFRLGPLDINFPRGQLTLISGLTGSGKSAMLLALLGGMFPDSEYALSGALITHSFVAEMQPVSGTVHIDKTNHRVAYCAQNPCKLVCFRSLLVVHSSRNRARTGHHPR
jgi:ABC-type uncharacterized transport system fused permease/ATPase subunit